MKNLRPLLFFVSLLLIVGLACRFGTEVPQTQAPPERPIETKEPTTAPEPTEEPTELPTDLPTELPTEEAPAALDFFREEFESGYIPENWESFTLGKGEDDNLKIEQEDDHLKFDLGDEDLYVYYIYTPYVYDNVSITLNAENRGRNNNNVSLICRLDAEAGTWYEFSVESGGVWYLYAVDKGYNRIGNGGVSSLRQGKEVNEYRMDCADGDITLYVNDKKLTTVKDTKYILDEGLVGFNISSLNVLPITVNANWFDIAQPK